MNKLWTFHYNNKLAQNWTSYLSIQMNDKRIWIVGRSHGGPSDSLPDGQHFSTSIERRYLAKNKSHQIVEQKKNNWKEGMLYHKQHKMKYRHQYHVGGYIEFNAINEIKFK